MFHTKFIMHFEGSGAKKYRYYKLFFHCSIRKLKTKKKIRNYKITQNSFRNRLIKAQLSVHTHHSFNDKIVFLKKMHFH